MQIIPHKIGEKFTLISTLGLDHTYRVFRTFDGKYFNKQTQKFEQFNDSYSSDFEFYLYPHPTSSLLRVSRVNYLPKLPLDLIFEFMDKDKNIVFMERHTYGGFHDESKPQTCIVFGKIYDPMGHPISNARVEVAVNRDAYFTNTFSNVGPSTFTVTDSAGYFELPLVKGLQVTINIPATGFVTSGFVPTTLEAVELNYTCLSKRIP